MEAENYKTIYKELETIIYELLFGAYEQSDNAAQLEIKKRITENAHFGICESETKTSLLQENVKAISINNKGASSIVEARRNSQNNEIKNIFKNYKFSVFDVFKNGKEVKPFVDYLTTQITPYCKTEYFNKIQNKLTANILGNYHPSDIEFYNYYIKETKEARRDFLELLIFNEFLQIFKSYRIVEILHAQQPEQQKAENGAKVGKDEVKHPRIIDTETLKIYFKPTFKGSGSNINQFNSFVDELNTEKTPKEFAQIALMCFEGKQMNDRKPKTWKIWLETFYNCVGCVKVNYDNKNNLRNSTGDNLKKLFSYLQ